MAVRAYDQITRHDNSLFRKQRVFHSHFSGIVEMGKFLFFGKIPQNFCLHRRGNIFVRHKMIRNKYDSAFIKHCFRAAFIKLPDGNRCGDIISQSNIHLCIDQITRLHMIQACMSGKNFFRYGHSHIKIS